MTEKAENEAVTVLKISQHGVVRPKDGTTTGRVWEIADAISHANGEPADRATVIKQVVDEGINASTGATQYGKWRKFHGLIGEASPGRKAVEKPAKEPKAPKKTKAETATDPVEVID